MYIYRKTNPKALEEVEIAKDLNPTGFWECPFTVRGVQFRPNREDQLKQLEAESKRNLTVCKIVSGGLAQSDPRYIDKIVFMLRHPRSVAKSQERLRRNEKYKKLNGESIDLYQDKVVHSPKMFIQTTVMAAAWLKKHPEIPVHYVLFDDLISYPEGTLLGIQQFLGEGNFLAAASAIRSDLKRSYPEQKKSNLWGDAEYVWDKFLAKDFSALAKFSRDITRPISREGRSWPCARLQAPVVEAHCRACRHSSSFRAKLIEDAEKNRINWQEEPCGFECGNDLDSSPITLDESIENNFWRNTPRDKEESNGIQTFVH
jgi:hypothetical protein